MNHNTEDKTTENKDKVQKLFTESTLLSASVWENEKKEIEEKAESYKENDYQQEDVIEIERSMKV